MLLLVVYNPASRCWWGTGIQVQPANPSCKVNSPTLEILLNWASTVAWQCWATVLRGSEVPGTIRLICPSRCCGSSVLLCMQKPRSQLGVVMSSVTAGGISSGEGFCVCRHLMGEILVLSVGCTPSNAVCKPGRNEGFSARGFIGFHPGNVLAH